MAETNWPRFSDILYNPSNFTSNIGTWTVGSQDVDTFRVMQLGNLICIFIGLQNTTVTGYPTNLYVTIPYGWLPAANVDSTCLGGATAFVESCHISADAGFNKIVFARASNTPFGNLVSLKGQIFFEKRT